MVVSVRPEPAAPAEQRGVGENLHLIGWPTLRQFIRYVRSHAVEPPDAGTLSDQWHAANALVRSLETEEAGLANDPPMGKLGAEYEPLLIELLKDPQVRHSFNIVPTDIALVPLDRLVVYQKHVDLVYARSLEHAIGPPPAPSPEQVFRTCLPFDHPRPPVKWSRGHDDVFVFTSPSNDLRHLGALGLDPDRLSGFAPPGNLVGVAGIAVGFSSNFVSAVYAEGRLILNNGTHRAYALRMRGITHVPCIVQHVPSRDALDVVGAKPVRRDPDFFLRHPRPTMLRDYFDSRLHTVMPVRRRLRQVTVRFQIEERSVPAW